jgi:hypothetical protein
MSVGDNGLYLSLPSGVVARAVAQRDSLIIMVGEGGASWLAPVLGKPLRAAPHSLVLDGALTSSLMSRAWYGKMYLPPADALLPVAATSSAISTAAEGPTVVSYAAHRSAVRAHVNDSPEVIPAACGSGQAVIAPATATTIGGSGASSDVGVYRSLYSLSNTLCDSGNGVMCWQQCYTGSDLPQPCGTKAECIDTTTGLPVNGSAMCPSGANMQACQLQCVEETQASDEYCYGIGTTMYMDGFQSIAKEPKGATACMNLLFPDWQIQSDSDLAIACIGVFLFAIFSEFIKASRKKVVVYLRVSKFSYLTDPILFLYHGTQVIFGYFLMLIAMTYNVELFSCLVVGLSVGYAIFNLGKNFKPAQQENVEIDDCCQGFDIDEEGKIATEYDLLVEKKTSD